MEDLSKPIDHDHNHGTTTRIRQLMLEIDYYLLWSSDPLKQLENDEIAKVQTYGAQDEVRRMA